MRMLAGEVGRVMESQLEPNGETLLEELNSPHGVIDRGYVVEAVHLSSLIAVAFKKGKQPNERSQDSHSHGACQC